METWKAIGDEIWDINNNVIGKCLNNRQALRIVSSHNYLVFQHKRLFKQIFDVCHDYGEIALTDKEKENYKR
jgi:hypothetical protein